MKSRVPALSKKRALLEKNLRSVVRKTELMETPLRIAELWVYGSFIRPKEEPGDVDLAVFYRPDEELDQKANAINDFLHHRVSSDKQLEKQVWDQALAGSVDALVEALDGAFGPDERHRRWLEISRAEWVHGVRTFGIWVLTLEKNKIIKTMLLGNSKTIHIEPTEGIRNIAERDEALVKKPHRLLWSDSSPDVDENLRLMRTMAKEAADKELPRFMVQLDQLDAEYSMIVAGISYLLAEMRRGRDITKPAESEAFDITYDDPSWGGEAKHLRTLKVSSPMEAGMVSWARKNGVDDDFVGAALSAYPYSFTQQFLPEKPARASLPVYSADVEELRRRSKELTRKLPFARSLRVRLSNLGDRNQFSAKDPIVEAVYLAYVGTQMYLAPDEVRTEVLQDLGLGHIVIPKRSEKGQPYDRYVRPDEVM
jgi:predicted nucleotidyltransferase